jgi:hypothetical protein
LFTPFSGMEDILDTPSKRARLEDHELQLNMPRAFGIVTVRPNAAAESRSPAIPETAFTCTS